MLPALANERDPFRVIRFTNNFREVNEINNFSREFAISAIYVINLLRCKIREDTAASWKVLSWPYFPKLHAPLSSQRSFQTLKIL